MIINYTSQMVSGKPIRLWDHKIIQGFMVKDHLPAQIVPDLGLAGQGDFKRITYLSPAAKCCSISSTVNSRQCRS